MHSHAVLENRLTKHAQRVTATVHPERQGRVLESRMEVALATESETELVQCMHALIEKARRAGIAIMLIEVWSQRSDPATREPGLWPVTVHMQRGTIDGNEAAVTSILEVGEAVRHLCPGGRATVNPLDPSLGDEWSDDGCDSCGEPQANILLREDRADGAICHECASDARSVLLKQEGWQDACCPEIVEQSSERCTRCNGEVQGGISFHESDWPIFCQTCVLDLGEAAATINIEDPDSQLADFWYSDGTPAVDREYAVGYFDPNGLVREWWPGGQLKREGAYLDGRPVGRWHTWSRDGQVDLEHDFGQPA